MGYANEARAAFLTDEEAQRLKDLPLAAVRSPIVFETAGLLEWWNRQVSACVKGMPRAAIARDVLRRGL